MITITFSPSKEAKGNITIKRVQEMTFQCSAPKSYDSFISNLDLVKKVEELDREYLISLNICTYLACRVDDTYSKENNIPFTDDREFEYQMWDTRTDRIIDSGHELKSQKYVIYGDKQYMYRNNIDVFSKLIQDAEKSKNKFLDYKKPKFDKDHKKELYLVFLYILGYAELFVSYNLLRYDIDIVDIRNTTYGMEREGRLLIPLREETERDIDDKDFRRIKKQTEKTFEKKLLKAKSEKERYKLKSDRDGHIDHIRCKRKFGKDIAEFKKSFKSMSQDLLEYCGKRLGDTRTKSLQVDIEKSYWLVKPTLKLNKSESDERLRKETEKFGEIILKKHSKDGVTTTYTYHTPGIKVWKSDKTYT